MLNWWKVHEPKEKKSPWTKTTLTQIRTMYRFTDKHFNNLADVYFLKHWGKFILYGGEWQESQTEGGEGEVATCRYSFLLSYDAAAVIMKRRSFVLLLILTLTNTTNICRICYWRRGRILSFYTILISFEKIDISVVKIKKSDFNFR